MKSTARTIEPMLERVTYTAKRDVVVLRLSSGALVEIPRFTIKELRKLSQAQLRDLKPDNAGMTLSDRGLDIDVYLPGLLSEALGVRPSAVLGRKGGASRSAASSGLRSATVVAAAGPRKSRTRRQAAWHACGANSAERGGFGW
jgi:hypothetical protein